ncbi:MAG TPA: dihydropteroate synthase [Jiangellales bacterium]|nr:dihydropteroate synthase [Jiangellales bacterium]
MTVRPGGREASTGRPAAMLSGLPRLRDDAAAAGERCLVMGVVNVTPDSFSDGGRWYEPDDAVTHGLRLAAQGADLVDVGGESTRPGAERPVVAEELRRVVPVIGGLAGQGVIVSVDTMRTDVAEQGLAAGAAMVNDVSGGLADPAMLRLVADAGVPVVLMHWRGHSADMQQRASYGDVVPEVRDELSRRVDAAVAAGVAPDRIVVDPGIGFAKTGEHNWALLHRLAEITALGLPVLVGASRKAFLGRLLADPVTGEPRPPEGRDAATAVLSAFAALAGAWCVRVHEVPASGDAVRLAARWAAEPAAGR